MSLVDAQKLRLAFGGRRVLHDASLRIGDRDRIGLVGPNGSGKTSLLRILSGTRQADEGELVRRRDLRVGYLTQDVLEVGGGPVIDHLLSAVPGHSEIEAAIETAERRLDASAGHPELQTEISSQLAELHERAAHIETIYSRHEAEKILVGLGFENEELSRPLSELSGGWRMRAALAALLFARPHLLLLDEPTNHLDLPSVRWLDRFLAEWEGAMVLISHDRAFLNRQINRVVSFEPEGLREYRGDYDEYRRQRDEEERILDARARNQERERRQMERFVTRFRAKATKARQVQSRVKALEKMEVVEVRRDRASLSFRFPPTARTAADVIKLDGITHRYSDEGTPVYTGLDVTLRRQERIVVVGRNGVGKTTLLRLMAGDLAPAAGARQLGLHVELGYYAQHVADQLEGRRSILEEVWARAPHLSQSGVRGILGAFLFSGDEVEKPITVLSGGERARVALATLLVKPGNVLLMDEPTNHLDVESADALAEALASYDGTLIFVSHNVGFASRVATTVWEVNAGGQVIAWPGTLAEYLERKDREAREKREPKAPKPSKAKAAKAKPKAAKAKPEAPKAKPKPAAKQPDDGTGKHKRTLDRLEKLRGAQKEIEPQLADPEIYADPERFDALLSAFRENQQKIEQLELRLPKHLRGA